MQKRLRLWSLPGGNENYIITLKKCLAFIKETNPHQEQIKDWCFQTFPSVESERTVKDSIGVIKNLGLIKGVGDKFLLNEEGERFLKTHNNTLVYQLLDTKYKGIHDIIELLYKKPQTLNEICSSLRKKIGVNWKKETQCRVRLNWLCSIGYVAKDRQQYRLTKEGRNSVKGESIVEKKALTHLEIQEIIIKLGKAYSLHAEKEIHFSE
ncbi:MAG: hypothetical protein D4S01_01325 [Dehalococcoidia bacterium]|nr:MAG: hypothetical protein D4S01_01325 [Dehalococcoidia bacterium]